MNDPKPTRGTYVIFVLGVLLVAALVILVSPDTGGFAWPSF